jgi:hypothetical protein
MRLRDFRQKLVSAWVASTFGESVASNMPERIARFVEEAVELAQAGRFPKAKILAIVEHVYSKNPGEVAQEVGGCGVTLLAFCAASGISADDCERREVERITSLPADYFREGQNIKAQAGVAKRSGA